MASQTVLERRHRHRTPNDNWGHILNTKQPSTFRIIFQNIQGLPVNTRDHKYTQLAEAIRHSQADFMGLMEINLNFPHLPPMKQWKDQLRHLPPHHTIQAYNIHNTHPHRRLFGGTANICMATQRVINSGTDPRSLGRWTWTTLQGIQRKIHIVTAYRPVLDRTNNPGTVYSQQEVHLHSIGIYANPRIQFWDDLHTQITSWIQQGDAIILGADINSNARDPAIQIMCEEWGLIDVHASTHPNLSPAATCDKNRSNIPVDVIWVSPGLLPVSCGYLPFDHHPIGNADHRALWLDIPYQQFFGQWVPSTPQQPPSRLSLHDPATIKKYTDQVNKAHLHHKIPQKIFYLQQCSPALSPQDWQQYNEIIQLDAHIRQKAYKTCRKLRMGAVPFSDVIQKDFREMELWRLLSKRSEGRRTSSTTIRRLIRQTQQYQAWTMTSEQLRQADRNTRNRYKEHKIIAEQLRQDFHDRLITRRAQHFHTSEETQRKITAQAFKQRSIHRRIKNAMETKRKTQMSMVQTTSPTNQEITCYTKQSIEQACMQEGQRRYSQTFDTPFLRQPMVDLIGYLADTPTAQEILDGTFCPPEELDYGTAQLLHQLIKPDQVDNKDISDYIATTDFQHFWQHSRRSTQSSPHGPNFTDYIAGSFDDQIAAVDAAILTIALRTGKAPQAWKRATDIMIPKKTSSCHVTKLRIIVLFHALFNMLNKYVGKNMIANAEKYNMIPDEAFGSRKNRRAIDCALCKVLTMDIARQTRTNMVLCSNDAKACYDRIVHSVATICMRRVGTPEQMCKLIFGTIQEMQHFVRTTYGDSSSSYSAIGIPLQGVLQGNGAGPAIWLIISAPLIHTLKSNGHGLRLISPISQRAMDCACYVFVDDCDLVTMGHDPQATPTELTHAMQQSITLWEQALRATGGALVVEDKSYWYMIHFTYENDMWTYSTIQQTPGEVNIRDHTGTPKRLTRLEPREARETLGTWIAMDGGQQQQLRALDLKITQWADNLRLNGLSTTEANISLHSGLLKSIQYPLPATNFTRSEAYTLQKRFMNTVLPALHLRRTTPHAYLHSPTSSLGLNIPHIWMELGLAKLETILRHGGTTGITGTAIQHVLESLHLELGTDKNFTELPWKHYHPLTTRTWLHSIWQFCSEHKIQLEYPICTFGLFRERDDFLIPVLMNKGLPTSCLIAANKCRMWLQVLRLSDITSGDGRHVTDDSWNGTHPIHNIGIKWPRTERPSAGCWKEWQRALSTLLRPGRNIQRALAISLGKWTLHTEMRGQWLDTTENRIYWSDTGNSPYKVYIQIPGRTRRKKYQFSHHAPTLPETSTPTTLTNFHHTTICHTGTTTNQKPAIPEPEQQWWYQPTRLPSRIHSLIQGITRGTACIICDGSYKDGMGTVAIIMLPHLTSLDPFIIQIQTPGSASQMNAYRAELSGIYASVQITHHLVAQADLHHGTITIGCDCLGALKRIFAIPTSKPQTAHHDLIAATHHIIHNTPIQWNWEHIAAHQDELRQWDTLSEWEQWNIKADSLAKQWWNSCHQHHTPPYNASFTNQWGIWLGNTRMTHWDPNTVLRYCLQSDTHKYWLSKKPSIPPHTSIAWEAMTIAFKKEPIYKRIWLTKWWSNTLPTGNNLHRWGIQNHQLCPRCADTESAPTHFLTCPSTQTLWTQHTDTLKQHLLRNKTDPALTDQIIQHLSTWILPTQDHPTGTVTPTHTLIQTQHILGWESWVQGFIPEEWQLHQHRHLQSIGSFRTGKRWLAALITKLWNTAWDLWVHRNGYLTPTRMAYVQQIHNDLDAQIQQIYATLPFPLPPQLERWVTPLQDIQHQDLVFKQQWIEGVHILLNHTPTI